MQKWIDPFVRTLVSATAKESLKEAAREQLTREMLFTQREIDNAVAKRLGTWIRHFENSEAKDKAEIVLKLKKDLEEDIPF